MNCNLLKYGDIINSDYSLLASSYSFIEEYEKIELLKSKYENIFDYLSSIDGYAFSSLDYLPEEVSINSKVPLIQIGNVNNEFCISERQDFEYLPIKVAQTKQKYLLTSKSVLISLTGGNKYDVDNSTFFDNDFACLLNQRVTAFNSEDSALLYYFYALTKNKFFNIQWIGKGAIQKNTISTERKKIYLPKIQNSFVINYISLIMQAIINKEKLIKERHKNILSLIENELTENQKDNNFHYEMPRIKEIENVGRLDTGTYSEQFKKIKEILLNYNNGVFYIKNSQIKSGSTPEKRYIGNNTTLQYKWITPTHCSDMGYIDIEERINLKGKNNIDKNCILLVNRGQGTDCGKSSYYNFDDYGKGQHNQGMYQVFGYENYQLIFMMCFLNTKTMRNFCSNLSLGSKMRELKLEQFLQIPFPNFPELKQKEIAKLYHNSENVYNTKNFTLENFLEKDNAFNTTAGIYELDKTAKLLKEHLNAVIDDIVYDRKIEISFDNL